MNLQRTTRHLVWLLPVGVTAIVYHSVTRNFFWADDFYDLWYLTNYGTGRFLILPHAGHSHVTRNAVTILCYALFGTHAAPYLAVVFLTHLLNVYLLFRVIHELTDSARVAAVVAGMWGIAPVQEETVGWFAVYGQVIVATCALWVLHGLARIRAGHPSSRRAPWLWGAAMIIGVLSFGIGIGVASMMPVLAWLLLPRGPQRIAAAVILSLSAGVGISLYVGQHRLFEALYHEPVWLVLPQIAVREWLAKVTFLAALASRGIVALILGPLDVATEQSRVLATLSLGAVALLTAIAARQTPRRTGRLLAVAGLFAFSVYFPIAIGRQPFINALNGTWMIRTPRYQYVGMIGAAMAVAAVVTGVRGQWRAPEWLKHLVAASCVVTVLALRVRIGPPVNHYETALDETVHVLEEIKTATDATPAGRDTFITNHPFRAASAPFRDFPGWAALFAIFSPDDTFNGHRVHFVVNDFGDLSAARYGRRAPDLLCGPADVPSDTTAH